jgi:predicted enzyme involved in methoxymalonyl-ACP biosynthesis
MSCRVLKRDMEEAMLDVLVEEATKSGIQTLRGYYLRTKKNGMVADHYEKLGFEPASVEPDGSRSVWTLDIPTYRQRNRHIKVLESVHG